MASLVSISIFLVGEVIFFNGDGVVGTDTVSARIMLYAAEGLSDGGVPSPSVAVPAGSPFPVNSVIYRGSGYPIYIFNMTFFLNVLINV